MFSLNREKKLNFYKTKSLVLKLYLDFCFITSQAPTKEIIETIDQAKNKKMLDELGEAIFDKTQEACRKALKDLI